MAANLDNCLFFAYEGFGALKRIFLEKACANGRAQQPTNARPFPPQWVNYATVSDRPRYYRELLEWFACASDQADALAQLVAAASVHPVEFSLVSPLDGFATTALENQAFAAFLSGSVMDASNHPVVGFPLLPCPFPNPSDVLERVQAAIEAKRSAYIDFVCEQVDEQELQRCVERNRHELSQGAPLVPQWLKDHALARVWEETKEDAIAAAIKESLLFLDFQFKPAPPVPKQQTIDGGALGRLVGAVYSHCLTEPRWDCVALQEAMLGMGASPAVLRAPRR